MIEQEKWGVIFIKRKLIACLLTVAVVILSTGATFADTTTETEIITPIKVLPLGDVTGDEVVDSDDLTAFARHVAKVEMLTNKTFLSAADADCNGTVDADDLTLLARHVAKIEPLEAAPLSEDFYGDALDALSIRFDYDDPKGTGIAGKILLSASAAAGFGTYTVCYTDENGILENCLPIGQFTVSSVGNPITVFNATELNAVPNGAVAIAAVGSDGKAAAYERIPRCKRILSKHLTDFAVLSDVHVFYDEPYNGQYVSKNGKDDLERAVSRLNALDIDHVSVSGDLIMSFVTTDEQIRDELALSTSILKKSTAPVYVIKGNHDKKVDETVWKEMTGCDPDYYFVSDDTYFVYLSLKTVQNVDSNDTTPYGSAKVAWLEGVLDKAKGKRVILFMHYPFNGSAGLPPNTSYGFTAESAEEARILSAIRSHGAVTVFNGHTHYDFQSTLHYDNICVDRLGNKNNYAVHVPSCAYPRDYTRTDVTDESQCYIVRQYRDGLLLQGYDLVTGKVIPFAIWYLDTRLLPNSPTTEEMTVGVGSQKTVTMEKAYQTAEFRSLDTSVATVDASGVVTGIKSGKTAIVAVVDGFSYRIDITVSLAGSGTKADPYLISTASQFVDLQNDMKKGETFSGKYYKLTADIDLNDCPGYSPMTNASSATFAGFFDGCGHTVKAVTGASSSDFAVPYFYHLTGTVINTGFDCHMGGSVMSSYIVARDMNGGKCVNCFVTGSIVANTVKTSVVCGTSTNVVLQNMFINVSLSGTTPGGDSGITAKGSGKVGGIYYIANGCAAQFGETKVTSGTGVAQLLNTNRSSAASNAGIDSSLLCSWQEKNGLPVLVTK